MEGDGRVPDLGGVGHVGSGGAAHVHLPACLAGEHVSVYHGERRLRHGSMLRHQLTLTLRSYPLHYYSTLPCTLDCRFFHLPSYPDPILGVRDSTRHDETEEIFKNVRMQYTCKVTATYVTSR
jgi:hypothetical protein